MADNFVPPEELVAMEEGTAPAQSRLSYTNFYDDLPDYVEQERRQYLHDMAGYDQQADNWRRTRLNQMRFRKRMDIERGNTHMGPYADEANRFWMENYNEDTGKDRRLTTRAYLAHNREMDRITAAFNAYLKSIGAAIPLQAQALDAAAAALEGGGGGGGGGGYRSYGRGGYGGGYSSDGTSASGDGRDRKNGYQDRGTPPTGEETAGILTRTRIGGEGLTRAQQTPEFQRVAQLSEQMVASGMNPQVALARAVKQTQEEYPNGDMDAIEASYHFSREYFATTAADPRQAAALRTGDTHVSLTNKYYNDAPEATATEAINDAPVLDSGSLVDKAAGFLENPTSNWATALERETALAEVNRRYAEDYGFNPVTLAQTLQGMSVPPPPVPVGGNATSASPYFESQWAAPTDAGVFGERPTGSDGPAAQWLVDQATTPQEEDASAAWLARLLAIRQEAMAQERAAAAQVAAARAAAAQGFQLAGMGGAPVVSPGFQLAGMGGGAPARPPVSAGGAGNTVM